MILSIFFNTPNNILDKLIYKICEMYFNIEDNILMK